MRRGGFLLLAAAASLWLAGVARAITVPISFSVEVGTVGNTMTLTEQDFQCGPSEFGPKAVSCGLMSPMMGPMWRLDAANLELNPEPSVFANVALVNTSATTQSYVFSVTLPVSAAFGPPSLVTGSVGGSLTDSDGSGSASFDAAPPASVYSALIDGSVVRTLFDPGDPSLPVTVGVAFGTSSIGPRQFGIPTPESLAVATTASVGIALQFTLSGGDSVALTSVFNDVVPEPATLCLLGIGLVGLALAARRGH